MSGNRTELGTILNTSSVVCPSPQNEGFLIFHPNTTWIDFSRPSNGVLPPLNTERGKDRYRRLHEYKDRKLNQVNKLIATRACDLYDDQCAVNLINEIFPNSGTLFSHTPDRNKTAGEYAVYHALDLARGFEGWVHSMLPEAFHHRLEKIVDVDSVGLSELLKIYSSTSANDSIPRQRQHEAAWTLAETYMASLAELSNPPGMDHVLNIFSWDVNHSFPQEKYLEKPSVITVGGQVDGKKVINPQMFFVNGHDNNIPPGFIGRDYKIRYFGDNNGFVIIQNREGKPKDVYSAMFKMWRERKYPLGDMLGSRIILDDYENLGKVIGLLKTEMPDWEIKPEEDQTRSPESAISHSNWEVTNYNHRNLPIELQIYWISENGDLSKGNWIPKTIQPDTNDPAYRMKQLRKSLLPYRWPKEIYGIDWDQPKVVSLLMDHANNKALGK